MPRPFSLVVIFLFFVGPIVQFETPPAHASQPDFVLSLGLETITLRNTAICDGGRISYEGSVSVYIVGENGFSGTVNLSAFVTPSGPTVSLDLTSVYLSTANPYGEVGVTIRPEQVAPFVEYLLNVTGASGATIHSVNVTAIPYKGTQFLTKGPSYCPAIPHPAAPSPTILGLRPSLFYRALIAMIFITSGILAIIVTRRNRS